MILHARAIPEVIASFVHLDIDRLWVTGFLERELWPVFNEVVLQTDYDNYIIVSDDCIVSSAALARVRLGLETRSVFTGWCELWPGAGFSTVRGKPLGRLYRFQWRLVHRFGRRFAGKSNQPRGALSDARTRLKTVWFQSTSAVRDMQAGDPDVRTFFASFALSGLRRDVLLRFPIHVVETPLVPGGTGSDYFLTEDLVNAGIPIYTASSAFVEHLASQSHWLVGKVDANVTLETSNGVRRLFG